MDAFRRDFRLPRLKRFQNEYKSIQLIKGYENEVAKWKEIKVERKVVASNVRLNIVAENGERPQEGDTSDEEGSCHEDIEETEEELIRIYPNSSNHRCLPRNSRPFQLNLELSCLIFFNFIAPLKSPIC